MFAGLVLAKHFIYYVVVMKQNVSFLWFVWVTITSYTNELTDITRFYKKSCVVIHLSTDYTTTSITTLNR